MTLSEMRKALSDIIQDPSYTITYLNQYINYAYMLATGSVDLPSLKAVSTLTTIAGQAYVDVSSLTGGFGGRFTYVGRTTTSTKEIRIYPKVEDLLSAYPNLDETGNEVEAIATEGSTLWIQPYPEDEDDQETLKVVYYRNPNELSENNDTPSYIPAYLHRELIVNGAAWVIFDQIEDGLDGEKVNAKAMYWRSFAENNTQSGISLLRQWVSRNRINFISSTWAN